MVLVTKMVLIGPQPGKLTRRILHAKCEIMINILYELFKQQTSFENKRLGNGDNFVVIASSLHPLLLAEHVEVNIENQRFTVECSRCH